MSTLPDQPAPPQREALMRLARHIDSLELVLRICRLYITEDAVLDEIDAALMTSWESVMGIAVGHFDA
jgi:hypothetical protein